MSQSQNGEIIRKCYYYTTVETIAQLSIRLFMRNWARSIIMAAKTFSKRTGYTFSKLCEQISPRDFCIIVRCHLNPIRRPNLQKLRMHDSLPKASDFSLCSTCQLTKFILAFARNVRHSPRYPASLRHISSSAGFQSGRIGIRFGDISSPWAVNAPIKKPLDATDN